MRPLKRTILCAILVLSVISIVSLYLQYDKAVFKTGKAVDVEKNHAKIEDDPNEILHYINEENNVKIPPDEMSHGNKDPYLGTVKNTGKWIKNDSNDNKENNVKITPDETPQGNQNPHIGQVKKTEKWIIVTSIASPTEDIKSLAKLSEWQLLVVGDTKTPEDWHLDGVIFLSVATQRSLGYKVLEHIPYSNYARKSVGHLYAIQHGAKVIYETDDDNHPTDDLKGFITTDKMYGVVPSTNTTVFNPYAYYGQPTTWPRGYPLDKIGDNITIEYNAVHWNTALIQQGAVNGDPDVDAIYRLTRKSNSEPLNLTYDNFMPPLFFPKGTYAPWNSQNTLIHYNAFWGLLLPATLTLRVTDIWRSYFTQTLLWLIDGHLSYMPPNCYQFRNYHSYIEDAKDETKLYNQGGELVEFLSGWKCKSNTFSICIQTLADDMAHKGFWEITDAKQIGAWLHDLVAIGYKFPDMMNQSHNEPIDFAITLQSENRFPISVPPNARQLYISQKKSKIRKLFYDKCYNSPKSRRSNDSKIIQAHPILLLIIFNLPHYESIPYLEALYNGHFAKTIYCGPEKPSNTILKKWEINFITFEQSTDFIVGSYNYECVLKVLKLGLRVKGVLALADDTNMKVNEIKEFPLDEIWLYPIEFWIEKHFSKIVKETSRRDLNEPIGLSQYKYDIVSIENGEMKKCNNSNLQKRCDIKAETPHLWMYKGRIRRAFAELNQLQNSDKRIRTFLTELSKRFYGEQRFTKQPADVFYIPQKHFELTVPVMEVFFKHKVYFEYVVPTILQALGVNYHNVGISAYCWDGKDGGNSRNKPWLFFEDFLNSSITFLHPVKLSGLTRMDKDMTELFCTAMNHKHFTHPYENGP